MAQNLKNIATLSLDQVARVDQLCALRALRFVPTFTPITCGNPPQTCIVAERDDEGNKILDQNGNEIKKRVESNLCAIHALSISLRAIRSLNEGHIVHHPTAVEILAIFNDRQRYTRAYTDVIRRSGISEFNPNFDMIAEDYLHQHFLGREQMAVLLRLVNEDLGLHYRLGVITQAGAVSIDDERGPIVWVGHVAQGRNRHVSISLYRTPYQRTKAFCK